MKRSRDHGQQCHLSFVLQNTGNAPAIDVDITICFPAEAYAEAESERDDDIDLLELLISSEPKPDWQRSDFLSLSASLLPPSNISQEKRPRGPLFQDEDRGFVFYEHPKLRHKDEWRMKPVIVYLPPSASIQNGFTIGYEIRADNLTEVRQGQLHVVWQRNA
jgi:hypothetical protein